MERYSQGPLGVTTTIIVQPDTCDFDTFPTYIYFLIVPCYYIINLGCFICIIMLFYIIFGNNLLTQCQVPVAIFSLFLPLQKINTKWSPNGTKLFDNFCQTTRHPGRFGGRREEPRDGHKLEGRAIGRGVPPEACAPRGTFNTNVSSINTQIFPVDQRAHQKYFSAAASSRTTRSHLEAFYGTLSEGDSITEGFYINLAALLMMCEQFTTDLWVHSQQLDYFFSLSLSLIFSTMVSSMFLEIYSMQSSFAMCLLRSNELQVSDHIIYEYYLSLL